jgi:hypothetical protein
LFLQVKREAEEAERKRIDEEIRKKREELVRPLQIFFLSFHFLLGMLIAGSGCKAEGRGGSSSEMVILCATIFSYACSVLY